MVRNIVLIVALFIACTAAAATAQAKRPSFVLCMADDQGFGDIGYNSDSPLQTPVLDKMAATGLRFDRFYSAAPVCSPTRASIMTGRHPNRMGCFQWGNTLRPQELTLAEALRDAGYRTGHFGKWHLGSTRPDSPVSPGHSGFETWVSSPNYMDNDPLLAHNGRVIQHHGESSMVIMEQAIEFIREAASKDQPFLAVVWFGSPHNPHRGADDLLALYADADLSDADKHYFAEITGIDRAMGKLRDELHALGLRDTTLIWYTSDNGPQGPDANRPGSAGPFSGRKAQLLEGGIRVPAMIEFPSMIATPRTSEMPANSSDIYPTVLDLAGVRPADPVLPLDGVSLRPMLEGQAMQRPAMGFWNYDVRGIRTPSTEMLQEQAAGLPAEIYDDIALSQISRQHHLHDRAGDAAWIDGPWKLLIRTPRGSDERAIELFHVVNDPAEQHNIADSHAHRTEQMQRELDEWQRSVIQSLSGHDYN
jgi:arylsulfatase A-like enzyme